jgi:hypothetical protein
LTLPGSSVIVQPFRAIFLVPLMNAGIEALLRPRSIAILGASADFQKLNGHTLKALLDRGYAGQICPANPKYTDVADCASIRTFPVFPRVSISPYWRSPQGACRAPCFASARMDCHMVLGD